MCLLPCISAQEVREIVRLPGGYAHLNGYEVRGSVVRASRYGVTVCSKTPFPDKSSYVFYLDKRGNTGQVMVQGKPVKQAVLIDTLLFTTMNLNRVDSLYASVSLDGSNWKYYPSGDDRGYKGEQISCFAGVIAGYNYGGGAYTIDPSTQTSKQVCIDWNPSFYYDFYEVVGVQDGSVFCFARNMARLKSDCVNDLRTNARFVGSSRFNATELGDSVVWADNNGPSAMSLKDGGITMHEYPNRNRKNVSDLGIAGQYGQLYLAEYPQREYGRRLHYFSNGNNDPLLIELPDVSDTTSQILGGAWWNGSFYLATYIGRSNETVLYAIKEPASTVSVKDGAIEHQQALTQRIQLTRDQAQEWITSLSRSGCVQVFDVLGRQLDPQALQDAITFVVAEGKMWTVMVSGE